MKTTIGAYVLFALMLSACHAGTLSHEPTSPHASSEPSAEQVAVPLAPLKDVPAPAYLANLPNMACKQRHPGWGLECTSGDFRISAAPNGCDANSSYGKVHSGKGDVVRLWDRLPPSSVSWIAKLKDEQLVCVSADARQPGSLPGWYYVTAIPVHTVKACTGKAWCEKPGDLPIEWAHAPSALACQLDKNGRYVGNCPAGWVKASEFSEFSMGL